MKEYRIMLGEIAKGWGYDLLSQFNACPPEIMEIAQKRLYHCDSCVVRDRGTCSSARIARHVETGQFEKGCGCPLAKKSKSPKSKCPLGKW